ncbi:hypothetical protein [Erwinia sorbitola]|uniref:MrfJ n=1 Tax=Erwinia sorbitola TaxID=2681984 RepID=A0A6I6EXL6_9GAMM|nr:hypothetical protein [Erwinia sorbitola]MTD28405.1 hypothetical protein [Erwinia sorbitola]QGU86520.1 hypothetical protein GN242_04460 [Erwinia sorbitola]
MKMIKKTIWFVFFYVVSITTVHAKLYPVYSHETTYPHEVMGHYRLAYITFVEVGSVAEFIPRKGNDIVCLARKSHSPEGFPYASCIYGSSARIAPGEALGEVARRAYSELSSFEISRTGNLGDHCIGFMAVNKDFGHINWWDTVDSPVGTCISPTASNERCSLSSPDLTLNHGNISLNNTEGHSVASSIDIHCTGNVTVKIKLMQKDDWEFLPNGNDYIPLTPSGKAYITINGRLPWSNFNLPAGKSSLTIKDRLSGLNAAGIHYGSGIMIFEIL